MQWATDLFWNDAVLLVCLGHSHMTMLCSVLTDCCRAAETVKKELSQQYGVPLFPPKPKPEGLTPGAEVHPYNVRRAAVALRSQGQKLPERRRQQLQKLVRGYVNQGKSGSQLDGEGWLSPEEMEQALLAGLAPRQKRRTLRQLAAEKARTGGNSNDSAQSDEDAAQHNDSSAHEGDTTFQGDHTSKQLHDRPSDDVHDANAEAQSMADSITQEQDEVSVQSSANESLDKHPAAALPQSADQMLPNMPLKVHFNTHGQPANKLGKVDEAVLHGDKQAQQEAEVQQFGKAVSAEDSNGHLWHGKNVVAAAMAEGGTDALLQLIQRFRKSFTDALQPNFLPAAWHVTHRWSLLTLFLAC